MSELAVKPLNIEYDYTDEQLEELIKCKTSLAYFALNYVKVVHPVKGLIQYEPRDYQLRMFQSFINNRLSIVMCSRQGGKTISSMITILWHSIFRANSDVAILANKYKAAQEVLERIKDAYECLPAWLKPGVAVYNRGSIEFENGSRITASSTSKDSIRGRSCSLIFLDEFAHVAPHISENFWLSCQPVISTGGQMIITSTPNGVNNLFHKLWKEAEKGENNFNPVRVDWWEIPGRDEKWKEDTIKELGSIIKFNQEHGNCVTSDAIINIRDKSSGKNIDIAIGKLMEGWSWLKKGLNTQKNKKRLGQKKPNKQIC